MYRLRFRDSSMLVHTKENSFSDLYKWTMEKEVPDTGAILEWKMRNVEG
jgi:hypothetical protein